MNRDFPKNTVLLPLTLVFIFLSSATSALDRVLIPKGPFHMGCSHGDPHCASDEGPPGGTQVHVPAFRIDRNEITVAKYRRCVQSGQCTKPLTQQDNQYCNYDHKDRDLHPVNCLDWDQAVAYCAHQAARLPTEAEWEKAARGGTNTPYPWGRHVDCRYAILDEASPKDTKREPDGCWTDATWPVGSRPANLYGLRDMHGNIGEWTATWYAPNAVTQHYAEGELQGPRTGRRRVVRGGSWDENQPNLRSSFRNVKSPRQAGAVYGSIGFRCAADVEVR